MYFFIGLFASFIPFTFFGMIFGIVSVLVGAVVLAFYQTAVACIRRDLVVDRSFHFRAMAELFILIIMYILLFALIMIANHLFK